MNIENLEAFVYVVHHNSFHKAAEALFLSQPSISARIQSLERDLDTKLFLREGKTFSLTEKGKEFLPYAQQILQSYRKGKQQLRRNHTSMRKISIGSTVSVSSYILPEVLPRLKEQYPDMHIKLTTASSEAILEKVLQKEVDIGFVRNIGHPLVESALFYEDPIQLYVHRGHRFIEQPPVTLDELAGEPLIFFECGSLDWIKLHSLFETLQRPPVIDVYIDNQETAKKCIAKGMGIGFLPDLCAHKEVIEQLLFPVRIPSLASLTLRTNAITLKGEGMALRGVFLDLIRTSDIGTFVRSKVSINR
ncbi:LysR family transcriptional regulator [Brevibacillus choshinensis]|uniref:LysR family transcriptional regulator n=1 Tax=Brevibacillus choshinensis TaxID=54911 RepID=A0ABX7FHU9_BRECH|nr:LysR family transcriptional regulator [Brevibacillus choshinensis]QRG65174.1 LysR family transcriptional regulator [Brevibacillus choshinensis]